MVGFEDAFGSGAKELVEIEGPILEPCFDVELCTSVSPNLVYQCLPWLCGSGGPEASWLACELDARHL